MMNDDIHNQILSTLKGKSCLKQDVFGLTKEVFDQLKSSLQDYCNQLEAEVCPVDNRLRIEFREQGDYACEATIAGDVLIFVMHTNVSRFEDDHHAWKTSYLKEDENRAYCGTIHVYNFLADSFRHNRVNDVGYLIGRLFVNKDRHFYVQGKRPLALFFNDLVNDKLSENRIQDVIKASILYTLDFDLFSPPYEQIQQVSVQEMMLIGQSTFLHTGKRVGYKFQNEDDRIE